ncbi:MAG: LD-carboxypeptidase [Rhodoferax sp.]
MSSDKKIYVYSPSGAVRDRQAYRRGVRFLQRRGYAVEQDPGALARHQRFAGDDAARLDAILRAAHSGADVCLISRGGYGLTRILAQLPLDDILHSVQAGTDWVGLSDFTALQLALLARHPGTVTWAGPGLCEGFGTPVNPGGGEGGSALDGGGPDDVMVDCFDDMVHGRGEGAGWRTDPGCAQDVHIEHATLWGGNLATLCALVGTPYMPPVEGVLFLEDVAEPPYRVERMLTQLLHTGILRRQKAILLGQFTDYRLTPHDRGFGMKTVVSWLRDQVPGVPVLTNLPFGHVPTKVLLPVGATVELVVQARQAWLMWGHICRSHQSTCHCAAGVH